MIPLNTMGASRKNVSISRGIHTPKKMQVLPTKERKVNIFATPRSRQTAATVDVWIKRIRDCFASSIYIKFYRRCLAPFPLFNFFAPLYSLKQRGPGSNGRSGNRKVTPKDGREVLLDPTEQAHVRQKEQCLVLRQRKHRGRPNPVSRRSFHGCPLKQSRRLSGL